MKRLSWLLFLIVVFVIGLLPVRDTDFGWHYRCGAQFITTGKLCLANEFSYYLQNYLSANPHFLYDLIVSITYQTFGFVGLSIVGGVIMALSGLIFLLITKGKHFEKITSFLIMLFLSYSTFSIGLRSQLVTFFFFLLTLLILERSKNNFRFLFVLPILNFIWVNTHIGFFLGPMLFGIFVVDQLWQSRKRILTFHNFRIIILFIFSVLMTLVNPFGFGVYAEILNHALVPLNTMIAEWVGPPSWQMLCIALLLITTYVYLIKKKSVSIFQLLLLTVFAVLSFKARRNIPFFYTTFFFIWLGRVNLRIESIETLLIPLLTTGIIIFSLINVPDVISYSANWTRYCNDGLTKYPCHATKDYRLLSGNVYSMYEWGGFLIWQKPEIKVFVDGRMPAWIDQNGKSPYEVFLDIIQIKQGWNQLLRKYKTDYLFIGGGTFLDLLLQEKSKEYGWSEVYRNSEAVIYKNQLNK